MSIQCKLVGSELTSKYDIIQFYKSQLDLADYTTDNWDSFEESLYDALEERQDEVQICHVGRSCVSEKDISIYYSIVTEASQRIPRFSVFFDKEFMPPGFEFHGT